MDGVDRYPLIQQSESFAKAFALNVHNYAIHQHLWAQTWRCPLKTLAMSLVLFHSMPPPHIALLMSSVLENLFLKIGGKSIIIMLKYFILLY